ncbi:MAG: hypothetical protein P1P84_01250 [Deferrisomatales bacterium]|nr:hypothetical protein [Deferrisomatales bacterium]
MKRIINNWLGKGGAAPAPAAAAPAGVPLATVGEFLRHFPIGARMHYFPEYQRSVKLDTLVLGYDINGHHVYSDHAVSLELDAATAALALRTAPGRLERIATAARFCFLVPFKSRSEMDYGTGQEESFTEKTVNDFKRGNTITLFNKGSNGKVAYLDCTVARLIDLRDGVYANRRVAALEPDGGSFQFLDQRQYHRVYTCLPASLSPEPDAVGTPCSVQDFSDRFLRLEVDASQGWLTAAREGDRLFLTIHVPGRPAPFLLAATLHRRGAAYLVLALTAIHKDRRFQKMDLLDELDLKTTLLHHPETQRSLAEEAALG